MTKRKQKITLPPVTTETATDERLEKAQGYVVVTGGKGVSEKKIRLTDAPLDRLHKDGHIDASGYGAACRYHVHWTESGMEPIKGRDYRQPFAGLGGDINMPLTEHQVHHRKIIRAAIAAIGLKNAMIFDKVVCHQWPVSEVGRQDSMYKSEKQATADIAGRIAATAQLLVEHWGLRNRNVLTRARE